MMKSIDVQKVALMYNVLDEKDGCIKTNVLLYSVLKAKKKVERRTKKRKCTWYSLIRDG